MTCINTIPSTICYVTSNKSKFERAAEFFNNIAPHITLKFTPLSFDELQTDDQVAIAVTKAQEAYKILQEPLLVDDIGFYINRYSKFPGTMTNQAIDGLGIEGLLRLYDAGDLGHLRVVMVYIWADDQYLVFDRQTDCTLVKPTIFVPIKSSTCEQICVPHGQTKTMYELRGTHDYLHFHPRNKALHDLMATFKPN